MASFLMSVLTARASTDSAKPATLSGGSSRHFCSEGSPKRPKNPVSQPITRDAVPQVISPDPRPMLLMMNTVMQFPVHQRIPPIIASG